MTPDLVYFSTMSTANLPLTAPPGGGLELEAQDVLAGVRRSIRGVLEQLRGPSARPRDLEQALGLHKTLAWRVLRVAYGRDPLADVQHIPGGEGIEKFLSAAEVAGVEKVRLVTVRESVARFRALVDTHAGDRPSLEVMLRSMTDAPEPAADLRATRRAAFRCASYTWGTQTKARILSGIFTPCGGGLADVATVRAHVAMRRVRREGQLGLSRTVESATDKPGPRSARVEAVEPEGLLGGVPLLRDCCTRPLPEVEAVPAAGNNIDYRFVDQRIGARGAVTAYTAEIRRGLPGCLKRDESNTMNALFLGVRRPIEMGIVDLWAPVGLFGTARPRGLSACAMFADPAREPPTRWRPLPMAETAERLGRGLDACPIAGAPEYSGAMERVFARLGWDPSAYELHRLCVEYPVMGTSLALVVDLPE